MDITDVKQSYGRCIHNPGFFDRFYELFLSSHPDIPARFAKTDFAAQKSLLRQGITMVLMFNDTSSVFAKNNMERLQTSHDASHLNIPKWMYTKWTESLMQAVKEYDDKYTNELGQAWEDNLKKGVTYISEGVKA